MFAKKRARWLEKLRSKEIKNTELHNAILHQRPNDVRRALRMKADPNSRHSTTDEPALFPVCARGNIEITKILLNGGADPNVIFGTQPRLVPLVIAVIYNRTAICKILLSHGADPNGPPEVTGCEKLIRQEEKPVYHAAMGWRISISQVLLKGEWKKLYYENVKKTLEEVLSTKRMSMSVFPEKAVVVLILDYLRLLDVELDIQVITDEETWNHMEDENNPTLKYYMPYNTKRNLEHLLDDKDDGKLARTNNDTSINMNGSEIYGDVTKLIDDSI